MDQEQERALARLERALLACKKAGLRLAGYDDHLYATSVRDLPPPGTRGGYAIDPNKSVVVEDHGAYLDSGGW